MGLLSVSATTRALDPIGTTCTRTVQSVQVAGTRGFDGAVFATAPPNDFDRLFVVELPGRIRIVKNGVLLDKPFLDISHLIVLRDEQGLFSAVFHPDFANNGYFYVNYSNPAAAATIVARYHVSDDPDVADPASALTILTVSQRSTIHQGGQLQFGPKDGYLYIGMGDGGTWTTSQDPSSLLGKMLRLDVDNPPTYVPADNPFVGDRDPLEAVRDEIWAFGLRNPWRFSFDRLTGDLYIADVGAGSWEEIDVQPAGSVGGENYGWPCFEGNAANPYYEECTFSLFGATFPVWSFSHDSGCAVFGGYVYRGAAIPALYGRYFYSDLCGGFVKTFEYQGGRAMNHHDFTGELVTGRLCLLTCYSFGEDAAGELYCCAWNRVYKFVPPTVTQGDAGSLRRDGGLFGIASAEDCNSNCVPDDCEVAQGHNDCNENGIPDDCDLRDGNAVDCNGNGLPDDCEPYVDCNNNGTRDFCDIFSGLSADCNLNGVPDSCDIDIGSSKDANEDQIPDECEGACCQCNGSCALRTRSACRIVSGLFSGTGSSCGSVICGPPNNCCANRTILPSNANVAVPFDNQRATTDGPSTINCDGLNEPIGADLWYEYVAPCTGTVRASLCGTTQFDSILAVYGGTTTCDCQQIFSTPLACGDDTCGIVGGPSQVTVSTTTGRCYLIRVAGWDSSTGYGELQISYNTFCEPPGDCDGDDHVDMHDMADFQNCYTGANGGPIPPRCACVDLDGDRDVDQNDWRLFVQAVTGP